MDPLLYDLGLALGLGLLVGFQREWATHDLAGIRTFALITLLGGVGASLAQSLSPWVLAAFLAGVVLTIWSARGERREAPSTITTEIAALLMFAVGALVVLERHTVAVVTTGAVAVLLHWKKPLHEWVRNIGEEELRAIMRFVLIGLVILPALPDQAYGPLQVLNPFRIWLMVVLIVGISIGAYVVHRVVGPQAGTFLAGILGGLISSTATAVSYARRTRGNPAEVSMTALVLAVSSAVVFVRVLFEIAVVGPHLFLALAPPIFAMMAAMAAISAVTWRFSLRVPGEPLDHVPSTLATAIGFGLLYAAVLFGIAAAKRYFGETGLYTVAVLSGLTDVDAITLSTTELTREARLPTELAWRLILTGAMANLAFKGIAAVLLGDRRLRVWVAAMFGSAIVCGLAIMVFWPAPG